MAEANIAITKQIKSVKIMETPVRGSSATFTPMIPEAVTKAAKVPIMKTSECAKLIRRNTPYTNVYPSEISA
jgi:hypothetical protein